MPRPPVRRKDSLRVILRSSHAVLILRILVKVISDSGERDHVPRQQALESAVLL